MTGRLRGNPDGAQGQIFRTRMEAQCCRIRDYRREVIRKEGRLLSQDEAAMEWIERYAEVFAEDNDQS